jgi:diguanylate cyclase (GGDEF)-like protein/PAS domain S-box-containing protein
MIVGWALFRYRLFDLVPVAHHTLVENMEDGVIVADASLRIADMNPAAQHLFGINLNGVLGKSLSVGLPLLRQIIPAVLSSEIEQREITIPIEGDDHVFEIRITSLLDNRELSMGRLILMRDITSRKRTEEKLQILAITDPLTGIFNRRYFFDLAEREFQRTVRSGEPISVILIDVDRFKRVNDTYGHGVGDEVLQTMTHICRNSIRSYDVMARYGGEEFVILLPKTGSEEAIQVAERLRMNVAEGAMSKESPAGTITISLGVASLDQSTGLKFDQLLDRADVALYAAKRKNRNCVCLWTEDEFVVDGLEK